MAEQYKDPWADAANQAVGALYKYYLSQPTQADLQKQQYMQAQMERLNTQNEMDNRQMGLGNYALPNLSPEIRNDMYRRDIESRGETDAAKLFGTYVNKPMQVDAGDAKYIVDGSTGLPMQEYGVGVAPEVTIDKEGGRQIYTPARPATNRPAMPIQGQQGREFVMASADQAGVRPALADGVFGAESSYGMNQGPSPAGAIGPMQVMPSTAAKPGFGVQPAADGSQEENVRVGIDYLGAMLQRYQGDEEAALIAYNAGPANADKWLQAGRNYAVLPKPEETQPYVQKVLGTDVSQQMGGGQQMAPAGMQPQQPMAPQGPFGQQPQNAPVQQPDGTVITPLPTSPVQQQKQNEHDRLRYIQGDLVNDELNRSLNMLNEKGGAVAGFVGNMTSGIPGLPSHDFSQMLDTIKANIGFDKLQSMREASPTGGALGQVSEFENRLLQAVFGSLAQSQSPEQLRYNMMRLQNTYNNIIYRGYNDDGSLRTQNDMGPVMHNIPTLESVGRMNSPEELQGVLEFFNYNPPQDLKDAVIQRANMLGM
jgi:hypothetical protein